jgi:F-type H+-transporting ATPase subunit delta
MAAQRGAARRYAEAVFQVAREHERFDPWIESLEDLADLLTHPLLGKALTSPAVSQSAKREVLSRLLPGLDPQVWRFVEILISRDRLELVPDILAYLRGMVQRHRGIETAVVTTAVPIDEDLRRVLAERLEAAIGKRVVVETRVDPSILGGVVAQVGDRVFDASLRARLEALRQALAGA